MLRWFRERGCVHCLARDDVISHGTGYRYLHEPSTSWPSVPRTCIRCWTTAGARA
ncbi:hypothetical protein [Streptomyces sp. PSKA30]|uniref:hypothetical protein n=1 Tax=Streptomyces sp. PSKA30 TaxID=2874597 RepID=UPI0035ADEE5E